MASVTRSGRGWRAQVRIAGARHISRTFLRLTDAREWAAEAETRAVAERSGLRLPEPDVTVSQVIRRYIDGPMELLADTTRRTYSLRLAVWVREIGHIRLGNLRPREIAAARDRLAVSPATGNRYLAALSSALQAAVSEWGILESNPCRGVRRGRERTGRVRYLDESEIQRLMSACEMHHDRYLHPAVVVSLATGVRISELKRLDWSDVDLGRGEIRITRSKNGQPRSVPLASVAGQVFRSIWPGVGRIFPQAGSWPRSAFGTALAAAGIVGFRWHDLRHTCASYLTMAGVPMVAISAILGHRNIAHTARYSHLSPGFLRDAVEMLAGKIKKAP